MDLGSPPTAAGFRIWLADVYAKCAASSNRSQQRAIRCIKGAEACDDSSTLPRAPKKWQPFDAELLSAVTRYPAGELKRKLTTYWEQCYAPGAPPSGRRAIWHAIRKCVLERGAATQ
eukprot:8108463-Pyramimonas_sp.AAC.1